MKAAAIKKGMDSALKEDEVKKYMERGKDFINDTEDDTWWERL